MHEHVNIQPAFQLRCTMLSASQKMPRFLFNLPSCMPETIIPSPVIHLTLPEEAELFIAKLLHLRMFLNSRMLRIFSFCFVYTQLIFQVYKQDFAMLPRQTFKSNPPVSISQMKFMPCLFNNNPYHEWFFVYPYVVESWIISCLKLSKTIGLWAFYYDVWKGFSIL